MWERMLAYLQHLRHTCRHRKNSRAHLRTLSPSLPPCFTALLDSVGVVGEEEVQRLRQALRAACAHGQALEHFPMLLVPMLLVPLSISVLVSAFS